jgi:hypothetical protein
MIDFATLADVVANPFRLREAYANLLEELFSKPPWSEDAQEGRRIPWYLFDEAKEVMPAAFASPGLYIWGANEIPLYIGITRSSFKKRFRRYVGGERSQCQLAQTYETALREKGIRGFPETIRDWYRRNYGTSVVRLKGAVVFAKQGIDSIWFSLLPGEGAERIRGLERKIIPVANAWNRENGYPDLINVQDMP